MKKCPPGIICFENVTIVFIILIFFIVLYFYLNSQKNVSHSHTRNNSNRNSEILISQVPNYPYNNVFAPPPVPEMFY